MEHSCHICLCLLCFRVGLFIDACGHGWENADLLALVCDA